MTEAQRFPNDAEKQAAYERALAEGKTEDEAAQIAEGETQSGPTQTGGEGTTATPGSTTEQGGTTTTPTSTDATPQPPTSTDQQAGSPGIVEVVETQTVDTRSDSDTGEREPGATGSEQGHTGSPRNPKTQNEDGTPKTT